MLNSSKPCLLSLNLIHFVCPKINAITRAYRVELCCIVRSCKALDLQSVVPPSGGAAVLVSPAAAAAAEEEEKQRCVSGGGSDEALVLLLSMSATATSTKPFHNQ